ncbi:MAG: hypothetical protein ACOY4H_14165 [Thermodesulfobacteriota bacterium]
MKMERLMSFIPAAFSAAGGGGKDIAVTACPQCGYVLDRPHAFTCSRCRAEIPLARGCTGCGKCKNR